MKASSACDVSLGHYYTARRVDIEHDFNAHLLLSPRDGPVAFGPVPFVVPASGIGTHRPTTFFATYRRVCIHRLQTSQAHGTGDLRRTPDQRSFVQRYLPFGQVRVSYYVSAKVQVFSDLKSKQIPLIYGFLKSQNALLYFDQFLFNHHDRNDGDQRTATTCDRIARIVYTYLKIERFHTQNWWGRIFCLAFKNSIRYNVEKYL